MKKASIDLSLNTVIGLTLAVMAILVITSLVASLFDIFVDREKDQGIEAGFQEIINTITTMTDSKATRNIQMDENIVLIGFNPGQVVLEGKCNRPNVPRNIELSIERPPKCPNDEPCLCYCSADLGLLSYGNRRFDFVDCIKGMCRHFSEEDTKVFTFSSSNGCDIPLLFNKGVAEIKIERSGNDFRFLNT